MTGSLDVQEFLSGYLAEAEEHLSTANANLLALDVSVQKMEPNPKAVRDLFRSIHTLKGLSAMIGAESIVDVAHEMETLLRSSDRAGARLPRAAVDLLLKGIRAIEERVKSLSQGMPLDPAPKSLVDGLASLQLDTESQLSKPRIGLPPDLVAKLSSAEIEQLAQGAAHGRRTLRVDFVPSPARSAEGLNITSVRERVGKIGDLVKVLPRAIPASENTGSGVAFVLLVVTDATDEVVAHAAGATAEEVEAIPLERTQEAAELEDQEVELEPARRNFVRVDVERLDDALERLSGLIVSRSRMERVVADLLRGKGDLRNLSAVISESGRQIRGLRAAIMRARMVRVSELLERAPLIVRGLTRSSDKRVELILETGDAELDKSVADRLFPAIVHLLRNAVDHALESPEERKSRGKPAEGCIRISCLNGATHELALTVSDDGRGVDAAAVARRAGAELPRSDAELLDLMARPGLSTLEKATLTSGRGYGMDIVKRVVVDELGGELELRTSPGQGTSFTLRVPLSLVIMDAFSFVASSEIFVVPVNAVDDLTEVRPEAVVQGPRVGAKGHPVRLLKYRGEAVPLFELSNLLGLAPAGGQSPKAIIIKHESQTFGFQVDRMMGQQEIVVRPMSDPLVKVEGVAGSTDLGDGKATLVLDLLGLVARAEGAGA